MPTQTGKSFDFAGYYKNAVTRYVPIFLRDSGGAGKTGLTNADVNCFLVKPASYSALLKLLVKESYTYSIYNDGTKGYNKTGKPFFRLSAASALTEVDATNMPGFYKLELNAGDLDTNGILVFILKGTAIRNCYGTLQTEQGLSADISERISTEDADWDGKAM